MEDIDGSLGRILRQPIVGDARPPGAVDPVDTLVGAPNAADSIEA